MPVQLFDRRLVRLLLAGGSTPQKRYGDRVTGPVILQAREAPEARVGTVLTPVSPPRMHGFGSIASGRTRSRRDSGRRGGAVSRTNSWSRCPSCSSWRPRWKGSGLGERLEAVAHPATRIRTRCIGTIQEGRAQRALDALRSMEPRSPSRSGMDTGGGSNSPVSLAMSSCSSRRPRARGRGAAVGERAPGRRVGPDGESFPSTKSCLPPSRTPTAGAPSREPW